jgi:hypothetical protein
MAQRRPFDEELESNRQRLTRTPDEFPSAHLQESCRLIFAKSPAIPSQVLMNMIYRRGRVRGGGGNFGVVTSFEYQLYSVGPVLAGLVLYPFSKAKEALRLYREFATSIPDEVNTSGGLLRSPEGEPVAAIVAFITAAWKKVKRSCTRSERLAHHWPIRLVQCRIGRFKRCSTPQQCAGADIT